MFVIECSIFCLTVAVMVGRGGCLVELPQVEDNDIKMAEIVIRTTTNTLFSTLKLQSKRDRPGIQYFTLVHHYITTLTLQDYTLLKEIAKLTRVDKKAINNRMENFIAALTEIIDEEYMAKENNTEGLDEADKFIEEYMKELEYKLYYSNHSYDDDIEVVKLLMIQESIQNAIEELDEVDKNQGDLETWKPNPLDSSLSGRRIFKGQSTRIKHYPFMASVQVFNKFMCGGSIITSDLILTAASCLQLAYNNRLFKENPAYLSVRVGSTFYEGTGEQIPVNEVYFHPSYDPKTLHNNLAIMRLKRKINFKDRHVKKIELDKSAYPLQQNVEGILVLGWGARAQNNKLYSAAENKLATAILDFYPLEECREVYSKEYVTYQNFCGGFFSKGSGACNRDVGGPAVVDGILVGVISFGSPLCGAPDAPTVFTKVGYYTDWIEKIMEQDVPGRDVRSTKEPRRIPYNVSITVDRYSYKKSTKPYQLVPIIKGSTLFPVEKLPTQPSLTTKKSVKDIMKSILKSMYENMGMDSYAHPEDPLSSFRTKTTVQSTEEEEQISRTVLPGSGERYPRFQTEIPAEFYTIDKFDKSLDFSSNSSEKDVAEESKETAELEESYEKTSAVTTTQTLPRAEHPQPTTPKLAALSAEVRPRHESPERKFGNSDSESQSRSFSESQSDSDTESMALEIESAPAQKESRGSVKNTETQSNHEIVRNKTTNPTADPSSGESVDSERAETEPPFRDETKKNQSDIDQTILTLLYLSENEKDNDNNMNNIMKEFRGKDDVKIKRKNSASFRAQEKDKDTKKLSMNEEISTNIIFNILKEAVDDNYFKKKKRRSMR